jgi:V8-like Glu-specific endopeptidase
MTRIKDVFRKQSMSVDRSKNQIHINPIRNPQMAEEWTTKGMLNPLQQKLIINMIDRREAVSNQDQRTFPLSPIGALVMTWRSGALSGGTGVILNATTILTAAHCLYDLSTQDPALQAKFYPIRGSTPVEPPIDAAAFHLYPQWKTAYHLNRPGLDLAVIKLSSHCPSSLGQAGLNILTDSEIRKLSEVILAGYPIEVEEHVNGKIEKHIVNGKQMYSMKGKIENVNSQELKYTSLDSSEGQSGAPLLYFDQAASKVWCIGVHGNGYPRGNINIAARLTSSKVNWILTLS